MIARSAVQGFQAISNSAQQYDHSSGNHGGEALLTAKTTFSIPIDATIMEASVSVNSEFQRFTATEVRFGQMSVLTVVAYLWCNDGLSGRNWGILQQIHALISAHKLPFLFYADFNMAPEQMQLSGWPASLAAQLLVPDCDSTCKGSKHVLDYCIASTVLLPFLQIKVEEVPWGPHVGLDVQLVMFPTDTFVRKLVEPLPLPMQKFNENWKKLHISQQNIYIKHAAFTAHDMLSRHSERYGTPAILGHPCQALTSDPKFETNLRAHVYTGEKLAQASLQTELLVCKVAGVKPALYLGRSQYPRFENKPVVRKHVIGNKFSSPAANFWGTLGHLLEKYVDLRGKSAAAGVVYEVGKKNEVGTKERYAELSHFDQRFLRALEPTAKKISKMARSIMCLGAACTGEELDSYNLDPDKHQINCDWKGENPDLLAASGNLHIQQMMSDLHNTSDLVILEAVAMATAYKEKALQVKCSTSAKQWRLFCVAQLNGNVGAGVLHRFVNRQNAAPAVPLFKPGPSGIMPKTPNAAVEQDASLWKSFWQTSDGGLEAKLVLDTLRARVFAQLAQDSRPNESDMPEYRCRTSDFTSDMLE